MNGQKMETSIAIAATNMVYTFYPIRLGHTHKLATPCTKQAQLASKMNDSEAP